MASTRLRRVCLSQETNQPVEKSSAVPWASALRHGNVPTSFEGARLDLVARRSDGNREFARFLELCLTHSVGHTARAFIREDPFDVSTESILSSDLPIPLSCGEAWVNMPSLFHWPTVLQLMQ